MSPVQEMESQVAAMEFGKLNNKHINEATQPAPRDKDLPINCLFHIVSIVNIFISIYYRFVFD